MDKNIKWSKSVPIFKSSVILKQLLVAVGMPFGLVAIFILISSGDSSDTKYAIGLIFFTLIITYLFMKIFYGGKYDLNFIIDEKGLKCLEDKKQQKKSKALNILTIMAGIITNKPAVSGAAILSQSRNTVFIPWEEIRKVKYIDHEHVIMVYGKFTDNISLFCTEHNYPEVKELIQKSKI